MEGTIRLLVGLLATLVSIYSLLIIIRIMLTWFGHTRNSKPVMILSLITDPYLDWWRGKFNLTAGSVDLSPLIAMAVLSVVYTILSTIASQGRISLGVIAAICLFALWSAVSFILGFCFIVLLLRFFAYMSNSNIYSPFWQVIESISQPFLYRINRIIFNGRQVRFLVSLITSLAVTAGLWIGGRIIVQFLTGLLLRQPV